jgi:hypothetical protein
LNSPPELKPTAGDQISLYTNCEWRRRLVNLSLTLSSAFPLLKDLRRNRLSGRLMPLNPAPTPDKYEKKTARDAVAAPAPQPFWPRTGVNF